jgi:cytochrome c-type biogenesis protein CcmH
MMKRVLFCLMALCIAALPALQQTARAGEAAPTEFDPGTHKRVLGISQQLRCLVCQNQSIADSNAELAVDLRNQVVAQIKQGRTDKEIISYMVERYGDFVLYNPPLKASTVILWAGPAVLFFVALIWGYVALRRRKVIVSQTERRLTAEEKKRAEELLRGGNH